MDMNDKLKNSLSQNESDAWPTPEYWINAHDLLLDLKCLCKEFYAMTLTEDENFLTLRFNNGQTFHLTIEEVK